MNDPKSPISEVGKVLKQMEGIVGYLQHLESGVMALSREVQAQGLGMQMILKILIDKGVCTEEEVKSYHKEHVFEPLKKAAEEMQAKMKKAEEEAEKQIKEAEAQTPGIIVPGTLEDIDGLDEEPSNIVRFPSDKQDG